MAKARGWGIGLMLASSLLGAASLLCGLARAADPSPEVVWDGGGTGGRDACLRVGGRIVEMPVAHVQPFRSRLGGSIDALPERANRSALCVFGALAPDTTIRTGSTWRVASAAAETQAPEPTIAAAPFGGRCAEECDSSLTLLTDADRETLIALPERVRTELERGSAASPGADGGARVAREAAGALAGRAVDGEPPAAPLDISSGDVDCTWRRFASGKVATEPTQRCRVGRDASGAPTLQQLTGTPMSLRFEPLTDQAALYLGQADEPEAPRRDYDRNGASSAAGNRSGLAVEVGNQVHLVSFEQTGGFAVLTLSGN